MFNGIYKDKTVLVTGDTGFKGSWLSLWLKKLGAEVIGYSLDPPSFPNNFESCALNKHITHIHGDTRNFDDVRIVFDQYKPDLVFHLAAQALVRPSYKQPKQTFDVNIGGTVNVLEATRLTPSVKVFLNITSDKCYENREWIWGYRENDAMGGADPYSASKGCSELIFSSYLRSFFNGKNCPRLIGAASCRAGNAIGGGDWGQDRLIPDCIRALTSGNPIDIRNPRSIRPWQHVLELLSGYLWLGARLWEKPDILSGSWNFGPTGAEHLSVAEIVDLLLQIWESGCWRDISNDQSVNEAAILHLCCDKALDLLDWHNALSIHQAIVLTAEWYKEFYVNKDPKNIYDLCIRQIDNYIKQAETGGLSWIVKP